MASLYFIHVDAIECHDLPSDRPTRFDASGAILPASDALFAASIVPFSVTPVRFALVTGPSVSVALLVYSALLQRFGHRLEQHEEPASAGASRWLTEQFLTFPLFLVSGGWVGNWRRSARR